MFTSKSDSISNIHRRWSFTRVNPSSHNISIIISVVSTTIIILSSHIYFFHLNHLPNNYAWILHLPIGIIALMAANLLDFYALKGTPINKLAKVFHVSAFANTVWAVTILLGIVSGIVFSRQAVSYNSIVEGMFFAIGLRIVNFTSVFGAGIFRAVGAAFLQPIIIILAFIPFDLYYTVFLKDPKALEFGITLVVLAIVWAILADRAGRPNIKSTFRILQAFLDAWTENKGQRMEEIVESKAYKKVISTNIMKFSSQAVPITYERSSDENTCVNAARTAAIVLPGIHPGPFNPVGGSNLPYELYQLFAKNALIMHGVSDHSLNIPSKQELQDYLRTLRSNAVLLEKGTTCSLPVRIKNAPCTATGICFGRSVLLILSMAPTGMEDIPENIHRELQKYSSDLGLGNTLIVDSHNAMGEHLTHSDAKILLNSAKICLQHLKEAAQYEFKIGFANSDDIGYDTSSMKDLGQSGLATLYIEINDGRGQYIICWADSNNMEKGLHDHIISKFRENKINVLEICTSDTHSTSGKRNRLGYYTLGNLTPHVKIAEMFVELSKKAIAKKSNTVSSFELMSSESTIKVMGKDQFDDYSSALDNSMKVTKIFAGIALAVYIAMIISG
jgi:putative membrane protein